MSIIHHLRRRDPNPREPSLYDEADTQRRLSYLEHQSVIVKCQAELVTAQTKLARAEMALIEARQALAKHLVHDLAEMGVSIGDMTTADGQRRASFDISTSDTPMRGSET